MACWITFFAEGASRNSSRCVLYSRFGAVCFFLGVEGMFQSVEGLGARFRYLYGNSPCLARTQHEAQSAVKRNMYMEWCPGAELNHRHLHFQCSALPTELPGHTLGALCESAVL